jgi:DNA-binding transcriptional MocR family regulator
LLLGEAIERESVAFSPGQVFAAAGGSAGWHALRLAFADARPVAIAEGVARLARALEAHRPALSLAS